MGAAFAGAMARLGPFGSRPRLAVAASGGADSTALALLARDWAAGQGGDTICIIIDHGLREGSAPEAALTAARLRERGMAAQVVTLAVPRGPALQARARAARYDALAAAARAAGRVHLLLGHHAGDQAETVAMRAARGEHGLEGMPAWSARSDIVMIRPLLGVLAPDLKAFLREHGMAWVDDPSNADRRFERVRVRQDGSATVAKPGPRQAVDGETVDFLARHAEIRPEGFALVSATSAPLAALSALLRVVGGAAYAPARASVAALAANLRPATLGGVRIAPAGRFGQGWLLAREPSACAPPIPATPGAWWDGRFRLAEPGPAETSLGALGADARKCRAFNGLPSLILRTMPCLRRDGEVVAFPAPAPFAPPAPAASHAIFT